ncbi:MAG: cupin domain-containing protein [Firmicutes bacterium]|nr:cupin domain-containing protein [Bacillota bacterium]
MKRYRFHDLRADGGEHIASRIIPGKRLARGGLSFHTPGMRTHAAGRHVHDDHEVFCILQGRGFIEIDGQREPVQVGDVLVIEPGEDHHLIGDPEHPIVNLWFHASDEGHADQYPPTS